jgi:hypothetical protein
VGDHVGGPRQKFGMVPKAPLHAQKPHVRVNNINHATHSPPHATQSIPKTRIVPSGFPITQPRVNPQIARIVNTSNMPNNVNRSAYSLRPKPKQNMATSQMPQTRACIKRAAPAMHAFKWSPLRVPKGHCNVIPTAFLAFVPYKQPETQKHDIAIPIKEELVEGLLRYFNVNEPVDGPLPVITEAYKENTPSTLEQAMSTPYAGFWADATVEEWLSLMGNNTWVLIEREPWMKVIPCKCVFSIKTNQNGVPVRFKARLVAGGHKQTEGIYYNETYAPVSRLATLRTMLVVAARRYWRVQQIDIKTAFLNGEADTTIYMQ